MTRSPLLAGALALLAVILAACGGDDTVSGAASSDSEGRTIEVEMIDIAYEPATIDVEVGETVRLVFTNNGEEVHEAYVGDADEQDDHAREMADMDDMGGMDHGDDDVVTVEPGESGELTYTFEEAGTTQIGCHQPGHYEAGMLIEVNVA
ncbi:MAG: cupredoxin domain-containing protein [Solirubrobacterales bacterium]